MAFLTLDRLTKHFGSHVAVDGLTLSVEKGEFVSLLGPSGCGKTTTLQMIAGFVEPSGGAIRLEGRDLLAMKPAKRGLGIVFQSYALFPHMNVAENVSFGLEMQGIAAAERTKRVGETLELVGLGTFAARFPRQLSGGQQQRVALARALVIRPQILLLDEPLSNLDAKLREQMRFELQELISRTGVTTLYVTHDQSEALAMSDTVAVMAGGRIVQAGAPREVYGQPDNRTVADFLGSANFLRGKVVETSDGLATVALAEGAVSISVPSRGGLAAGAAVDVIFRPEDVTTHLDPAGGAIECAVERVVFQGGMSEYQLRLGTTLLRTVVHPSVSAEPGDRAWIAIRPERCILFAAG